jgi:hypothetical protein
MTEKIAAEHPKINERHYGSRFLDSAIDQGSRELRFFNIQHRLMQDRLSMRISSQQAFAFEVLGMKETTNRTRERIE